VDSWSFGASLMSSNLACRGDGKAGAGRRMLEMLADD
jgi:hypothetical protein